MVPIQIQTETIRLSQLLKLANVVQDGAEAKFRIANEEIMVNGAVEIAGENYEILVVPAIPACNY